MGGDEEEIERSLRRSNETVPYLFCLLRVTALTFLGNNNKLIFDGLLLGIKKTTASGRESFQIHLGCVW